MLKKRGVGVNFDRCFDGIICEYFPSNSNVKKLIKTKNEKTVLLRSLGFSCPYTNLHHKKLNYAFRYNLVKNYLKILKFAKKNFNPGRVIWIVTNTMYEKSWLIYFLQKCFQPINRKTQILKSRCAMQHRIWNWIVNSYRKSKEGDRLLNLRRYLVHNYLFTKRILLYNKNVICIIPSVTEICLIHLQMNLLESVTVARYFQEGLFLMTVLKIKYVWNTSQWI